MAPHTENVAIIYFKLMYMSVELQASMTGPSLSAIATLVALGKWCTVDEMLKFDKKQDNVCKND